MARTAERHIVTDTVFVRPKAQHINTFGAEERDAGFVGFRGDPGPGEVLAQFPSAAAAIGTHTATADSGNYQLTYTVTSAP